MEIAGVIVHPQNRCGATVVKAVEVKGEGIVYPRAE